MVENVQSPSAQRPNLSFYTWTSPGSLMLTTFIEIDFKNILGLVQLLLYLQYKINQ